jgi:hypothetical protein
MRDKMHLRAKLQEGKRAALQKVTGLELQVMAVSKQTDTNESSQECTERRKSLSQLSSWLANARKEAAAHHTQLKEHEAEDAREEREEHEREEREAGRLGAFERQQEMCLASANAKFMKKTMEPLKNRQDANTDLQYHG